jgi:hypothetical protein
VSLEQVIGWQPDWIVAGDPSFVASLDGIRCGRGCPR